jgi:transposase
MCAGIDVSKASLDIALWPDDTASLHLDRSENGWCDKLAAWLTEHEVRRVGLEASGGYEIEVMDALEARGFEVVRFNARRIRLFAKASGRLAKHALGLDPRERSRRRRGDRPGDRGPVSQAVKTSPAGA